MLHSRIAFLPLLYAAAALAGDDGVPKTSQEATAYTELASKYGPFAFAIIFGLVTLWLISQARAAAANQDEHVTAQARNFWVASILVGGASMCFAAIGTTHWLRIAESVSVFRGEIKDLYTYEQVAGDDFYFRTELRAAMQGEADPQHNMHFVVVQDRPFVKGQIFELAYF